MLEGLKRLFKAPAPQEAAGEDWSRIAGWANNQGYRFTPNETGYVIEGQLRPAAFQNALPSLNLAEAGPPMPPLDWRLEWGTSQREYWPGNELRLRSQTLLDIGLQAVLMSKSLQERMEHAMYHQYVDAVHTMADHHTPVEMRWLVMFNALGPARMGCLDEQWVAFGGQRAWLGAWVEAMQAYGTQVPSSPTLLSVERGRLTLRTGLATPQPRDLAQWILAFGYALHLAVLAKPQAIWEQDTEPDTPPDAWPDEGPSMQPQASPVAEGDLEVSAEGALEAQPLVQSNDA